MQHRLILLIGLPGSGKSTLADWLVSCDRGRQVVSSDRIRAQLFGDEAIQGAWLQVWREIQRQLQAAFHTQQMTDSCSEVIYDATNVVRRQRRAIIRLARGIGFTDITGLWLDVPLDRCLQRNNQRQRQVPEPIMHKMNRCLLGAPPHRIDGLDCLIRYTEMDPGCSDIALSQSIREIPPDRPVRTEQNNGRKLDSLDLDRI